MKKVKLHAVLFNN